MYPFQPYYQTQQQWYPWNNQPYLSQPYYHSQYPWSRSNEVNQYPLEAKKDPKTYSNSELLDLLGKHTDALKQLHAKDQQKQLPILIEVLTILIRVPRSILLLTLQSEFFSVLRTSLIDLLNQWCDQSTSLSEDKIYVLRTIAKVIQRLMKTIDDIELVPSWLFDSSLLQSIADTISTISTLSDPFDQINRQPFRYFIRLFDAYVLYQERFITYEQFHKDSLNHLLHPVSQCLSSSHFIQIFLNTSTSSSMTSIEKFFLHKCPSFIISYNGSQLEEIMESLLSNMLPQYVQLFDKLVPNVNAWKKTTMINVDYLLQLINHGANHLQTNAKLVSNHLSLVDNVLKLVNEPFLYNHLHERLSNVETGLMNSCVNFLVTMISDPLILAHIKQCQVANVFLRLTTCKYEPLAFNVYALLAYTTREDDIKAMHNPGRLLATIIKSLKVTLKKMPDEQAHKEQLLETLKGLIQHDQIKDEVIKQNALPFLLECTNKLTDRARILILEILWSLTFREESLLALRSNHQFLEEIQAMSNHEKDEQLKKAADGLVWKLFQEPGFLEKVAKQEEKEKAAKEVIETVIEEVVHDNGQKELIATLKPVVINDEERIFQYDMMISYCHSDKELTYKIHKFLLDQGFKVWIDLDNMYGPTMNAMAEAVENSEFVIMCMSDAYKQSVYCQAEAEYAFNCKRRLLPLIMRPGYKPDGWLGFLVGSRLYIDFSRYEFEIACEKLMTEISLQRKQPLSLKPSSGNHRTTTPISVPKQNEEREQSLSVPTAKSITATTASHTSHALTTFMKRKPMSNFNQKPVILWTDSDVLDFLFTQRLIQLMPICETLDGRALIQLYKMCLSGTSNIYTLLNDELKSSHKMKLPMGVYARFLSAMELRLSMPPPMPVQSMQEPIVSTVFNKMKGYVPLPPPSLSNASFVTNITPAPLSYLEYPSYSEQPSYSSQPSYSNQPYDLIITSDAPALDILKAIQRYGPNPQKLASIQTSYRNRF